MPGPPPAFTATDLVEALSCDHLLELRLRECRGEVERPYRDDPMAELLAERGMAHEQRVLDRLREAGRAVVQLNAAPRPRDDADAWRRAHDETVDAMRSGVDVIYQGTLTNDPWRGRLDFLHRVATPSEVGGWSYEVIDAKLARDTKVGAVIQLCLYTEMLATVQGVAPEHMHIARPDDDALVALRVDDFMAYFRRARVAFLREARDADLASRYPEPVEHCGVCRWWPRCDERWRNDDHLSLVAGTTRLHRRELEARGIGTLEGLGELPLPLQQPVDRITDVTLERIREQARVQLEGRRAGEPRYELLQPVEPERGLAALPEPSPADLFLDIEGDRYSQDGGFEYLFGLVTREDGVEAYTPRWAFDWRGEREAFENLVDFVFDRWQRHPTLHVYHFAPYESGALKRLMSRYGSREEEIDMLLRGGVLVDLHRVVRQGLRASVESYSLKAFEPVFDFERSTDVREATRRLKEMALALERGPEAVETYPERTTIEAYNREDCISLVRLRTWLEQRRSELEGRGVAVPRPVERDAQAGEELEERQTRVAELEEALTADVPELPADRTTEQHARWLLSHLLEWHSREDKSKWWEYYRWCELTDDELVEEKSPLAGLEYVGAVDRIKRSTVHRYRFPPQEHDLREGRRPKDPRSEASPGTIVAIDDGEGYVELKRSRSSAAPHPSAIVPHEMFDPKEQREALFRLAQWVVDNGMEGPGEYRAARDLLLRVPPRLSEGAGAALRGPDEDGLAAAKRLATRLEATVLPIQGPPGAGKTYTGARMIVELVRAGKHVGITANSHKVVGNLLGAAREACNEADVAFRAIQKAEEKDFCNVDGVDRTSDNAAVLAALSDASADVAGGTSWLWSRPEMQHTVDVLFIDEAGQMSLANVLAVSQGATSVVLLGDPQQLDQPQQGVHPPGVDVSALEHLLDGATTLPEDRGLFLEHTWRLHPAICRFTSELFYESRLDSRPELERQQVFGPEPFQGSGLRHIAVPHEGNRNNSPEEGEEVARLVEALVEAPSEWSDAEGTRRPLGLEDILVVAPYNAHVAALAARLPEGARVGTVDKFQGQEAAVAIYSTATSSREDAPRGLDFVLDLNRLNVAISRARCMSILVSCPNLLHADCRTPEQVRMANAFCRYVELAE